MQSPDTAVLPATEDAPMELSAAQLDGLIRRAVEDARGGVWGPLMTGVLLLMLGLAIGSLVVRDRVDAGLTRLLPEIESLRQDVADVRELAMAGSARPTSVTISGPITDGVASQVAVAQQAEAAASADHLDELTARRDRVVRERNRVTAELDALAAGGRVLTPADVRKVVADLFDRELAWISEERDAAASLYRRQEAISEAILSNDVSSEAFAAPLKENVRRRMQAGATVEPTPEDTAIDANKPDAASAPGFDQVEPPVLHDADVRPPLGRRVTIPPGRPKAEPQADASTTGSTSYFTPASRSGKTFARPVRLTRPADGASGSRR